MNFKTLLSCEFLVFFRSLGLQQQLLLCEQPHKHLDMDGAHDHVRPAEGGQGDGLHLALGEVSIALFDQSESDSATLLDTLLLCIRHSEHSVSLLL